MDATPASANDVVKQADTRLANLLRLADALPEFAVSPTYGGAAGGDGGTVTDVLAQVLAEQEELASWLEAPDQGDPSAQSGPHFGAGAMLSQHAHRPYRELRERVEAGHKALCDVVLARDGQALDALRRMGERYEWAQTVLGQCAL